MIRFIGIALLLAPLLFSACSHQKSSAPVVARKFLQSRQELLAKYGEPTATKPSKIFSPGNCLGFRSETLEVDAEFLGDECHYIRYTLPQPWTDAQIRAALEKNGSGWQQQPDIRGILPAPLRYGEFTSTEGHNAKYSAPVHWLEIWSCHLVEQARLQKAEKERKAAQVPKF